MWQRRIDKNLAVASGFTAPLVLKTRVENMHHPRHHDQEPNQRS